MAVLRFIQGVLLIKIVMLDGCQKVTPSSQESQHLPARWALLPDQDEGLPQVPGLRPRQVRPHILLPPQETFNKSPAAAESGMFFLRASVNAKCINCRFECRSGSTSISLESL